MIFEGEVKCTVFSLMAGCGSGFRQGDVDFVGSAEAGEWLDGCFVLGLCLALSVCYCPFVLVKSGAEMQGGLSG